MGNEQPKLKRLPGQENMPDAEVVIDNKYREKMRKTEDELARLRDPQAAATAKAGPRRIDAGIVRAQQTGIREIN